MPNVLINLDVPDLAKAEAFYRDAFGLTPARRFGNGGVEMLGWGAPLYLLVKSAGSRATAAADATRDYARHWMPLHFDVVVDDLAAAIERAVAAGARREGDTREAEWGRIAQFADPFGHGFCILQFLNRGYDEISS